MVSRRKTSTPATEEHSTASLHSRDDETPTRAATTPREGSVIAGKYLVERVLGSGGMGVVVSALHLTLRERVAVKFLTSSAEGMARLRFHREAQVAARIKSEHIARTMDVGTFEDGSPYLVMEFLTGQSLAARLRSEGNFSLEDAVDDVLQAAEVIAEAHAIGVVHRDLKPSNLFLTQRADGSPLVKVLDFGIAKLLEGHGFADEDGDLASAFTTGTAAVLGTPLYMSPEQGFRSHTVDARADIWSLGIVLHELLCGAPPFNASTIAAAKKVVMVGPPARLTAVRPDCPLALENVILRCLEKDRDRRFADVGAFAAALAPFAPHRSRVCIERAINVRSSIPRATLGPSNDGHLAPASSPTEDAFAPTLRDEGDGEMQIPPPGKPSKR